MTTRSCSAPLAVGWIAAAIWLAGCDNDAGRRVPGDARATDGSVTTDGTGQLDGIINRDGPGSPDACTPVEVDCTDRCGPIADPCTGEISQCGGCTDDGLVCDLLTNLCITPLVTCEDLLAECGKIKNSCGFRLNCGPCPEGEECDPDTNTCVACTEVTCADLGFDCGTVWLGCGPESNTTDCGPCEEGVCNTAFNICEPDCTPGTTEEVCTTAQTERGVECGSISDGCGGVVNCDGVLGGCPTGQKCGVRGVANRCAVPELLPECEALGRNCGEIESVCGGTISCGTCPEDQVCNPNGVCGPPCTPKTCEADYAGQCGIQLDDGCFGRMDCNCGGDDVCSSTAPGQVGSCEALNTCDDFTTREVSALCSNDRASAFPRGDGTNLTCRCKDGSAVCIDASKQIVSGDATGTCCLNQTTCATNNNACTATDDCTGEVSDCCGDDEFCGADNTCKTTKDCSDYVAHVPSREGEACTTLPGTQAFPVGDGSYLQCDCLDDYRWFNNQCINETTSQAGVCDCTPRSCPANDCSLDGQWDGCGARLDCCPPGQVCYQTDCCTPYDCVDLQGTGDGDVGDPCGTLDDNCGGTISCDCKPDLWCYNGVCCNPNTCAERGFDGQDVGDFCGVINTGCGNETCTCDSPLVCYQQACCQTQSCGTRDVGDRCDDVNLGCGVTRDCACNARSGLVCDRTTDLCCDPLTCDEQGWDGRQVGDYCGPNPNYGCHRSQNCTCDSPLVCYQEACCRPGSCGTRTEGERCDNVNLGCGIIRDCACNGDLVCHPSTGRCCDAETCAEKGYNGTEGKPCGSFSDTCGGTVSCGCRTDLGLTCYQNECCDAQTCGELGAGGAVGDPCGSLDDQCGGTVPCACSTAGGLTNNTCSGGTCSCTPTPKSEVCAAQTGLQPDGCGDYWNCDA